MDERSRPVLLISLDWMRAGDGRKNLGAASVVAALRHRGIEVVWMDDAVNRTGFDIEEVLRQARESIRELGPGVLVGIGCYVWNEREVQQLSLIHI